MKKTVALLLAALLTVSFAACSQKTSDSKTTDDTENVQIPNPIKEVDSADAFRSIGISVDAPEDAKDVTYRNIGGEIAEVVFTLNEHVYTLRASKTQSDFSGLYGDVVEKKVLEGGPILETVQVDIAARRLTWTSDSMETVLINMDGADEAAMLSVYNSIG